MKTISIAPSGMTPGVRRLFSALARVIGFNLVERTYEERAPVDAWIFPRATADESTLVATCPVPCFLVAPLDRSTACPDSGPVRFAHHDSVPWVFAGRQVPAEASPGIGALPSWAAAAVPVAWKDGVPVWAVDRSAGGVGRHHVAMLLPALEEGEALFPHFSQDRFLALLPLFAFLREVTEDPGWEGPPIQACFMFDDPNLHWKTYGYIDFEKLINHAAEFNYHVASATIPLDSWFVHGPTAAMFRSHSDRVSLLMHGNDHINEELARRVPESAHRATLAQAIRRIEDLERRSGVDVSRVMAPPHGACSEESLRNMALLGYEAACISRGSLRHFNPGASWTSDVGMRPSDIIGGLPVLPRFRIAPTCQNSILLAVLLRQPIIPVGHHQDVATGLELFAQLASFINSLGKVQWASMTDMSRSHYSRRIDGKALHIRMHAISVDLVVPDDVEQVVVWRPWLEDGATAPLQVTIRGADGPSLAKDGGATLFAAGAGQRVSIRSGHLPLDVRTRMQRIGMRPWPMIRRILTETRDRIAPQLGRT